MQFFEGRTKDHELPRLQEVTLAWDYAKYDGGCTEGVITCTVPSPSNGNKKRLKNKELWFGMYDYGERQLSSYAVEELENFIKGYKKALKIEHVEQLESIIEYMKTLPDVFEPRKFYAFDLTKEQMEFHRYWHRNFEIYVKGDSLGYILSFKEKLLRYLSYTTTHYGPYKQALEQNKEMLKIREDQLVGYFTGDDWK